MSADTKKGEAEGTVLRILGREAILAASDIQTETVDVPEWGGAVLVRGLTGDQRDAFEASLMEIKGKTRQVKLENLRAKLVVRSVVDAEGKRVFSDADAVPLGKKSAAAIQRVFTVAQRLSGLSDEEVDELTEDFGDGQNSGSGTD